MAAFTAFDKTHNYTNYDWLPNEKAEILRKMTNAK
jgi:hypothetical protein